MNIYFHRAKHLVQGVSFAEGMRHLAGAQLNASYPILCKDFGDVVQDLTHDITEETLNATFAVAEGVAEVISIGLDALVELALQPHQQSVSTGVGGGSTNNRGWNDDDKKRKNNNENYKPYKFRR